MAMRIIDGSLGEGGGQILRTALALAAVTGTPFRIEGIRAGRKKPGLLRQHLVCVEAATAISGARVRGAELSSLTLEFEPGPVKPGTYTFSISTAGSTTLVLQTVLPPLLMAVGPSQVTVEGGTHNPMAPTIDYIKSSFLPLVNRLGPKVHATLERAGFYPAGGGRVSVSIEPHPMTPFDLMVRGPITAKRAVAIVSNLPAHIARRELVAVKEAFQLEAEALEVRELKSPGPGNVLTIECETQSVCESFTSFGEKAASAELVAKRAIAEAREWIVADVPVGPHLADQWVLMLALAGGGRFRTMAPTPHLRTNIEVIREFLPVDIGVVEAGSAWEVSVTRR